MSARMWEREGDRDAATAWLTGIVTEALIGVDVAADAGAVVTAILEQVDVQRLDAYGDLDPDVGIVMIRLPEIGEPLPLRYQRLALSTPWVEVPRPVREPVPEPDPESAVRAGDLP